MNSYDIPSGELVKEFSYSYSGGYYLWHHVSHNGVKRQLYRKIRWEENIKNPLTFDDSINTSPVFSTTINIEIIKRDFAKLIISEKSKHIASLEHHFKNIFIKCCDNVDNDRDG